MHPREAGLLDDGQRLLERRVVLTRKPTMTSAVRLKFSARARRRRYVPVVYLRPIALRTPSSPDCSGTRRCGETAGVSRIAAISRSLR